MDWSIDAIMVTIPIELFGGFIGMSLFLVIIGFMTNPKMPVLMMLAGTFVFAQVAIVDGLDFHPVINPQIDQIFSSDVCSDGDEIQAVHYNQTTGTTATGIYSTSFNYAGIHVNTGSLLIGDTVNNATFWLSKTGAPTGTIRVAVYDSTAGTPIQKYLFGTLNIATQVSTTAGYISVVNATNEYSLVAGDRIAVLYSGGDASNRLNHFALNSNIFDGSATESNFLDPPAGWTNGGSSWDSRAIISGSTIPLDCDSMLTYTYLESEIDVIYSFGELEKSIYGLYGATLILIGVIVLTKEK